MSTFLFTFMALSTVMVIASIGTLNGRRALRGSCGGVGAALGEKDYTCSMCGGDPGRCNEHKVDLDRIVENYELGRELGS